MVLSHWELLASSASGDARIVSLLQLRCSTPSFITQCVADREIQVRFRDLNSAYDMGAYDFNCAVVHNPILYAHFPPFTNHGWNGQPMNNAMADIYHQGSFEDSEEEDDYDSYDDYSDDDYEEDYYYSDVDYYY